MTQLYNWYKQQIAAQKLSQNSSQEELIEFFDRFITKIDQRNFITRRFYHDPKLGFYIYGAVGVGKTMLMNAFFEFTPGQKKLRVHFHLFMAHIHQSLANLNQQKNPLSIIAKTIKRKYDFMFLDEMHISDIASAMMIRGLFASLFKERIHLIITSNYHPDKLWPDGLMRERFLPAIELIKQQLNIQMLHHDSDYRMLHNSTNNLFIHATENATDQLKEIFNKLNNNQSFNQNGTISLNSHQLAFVQKSENGIWLDFDELCNKYTSQIDYLLLSTQFKWFILSGIYYLNPEKKDVARRFTWLIDILYDNTLLFACSACVILDELYEQGEFAYEFTRTVSRLKEMQTLEYLHKAAQ